MKSVTNLGTLGRVLEVLKEEGIVDIPENISPEDIAYQIVFLMNKDSLIGILEAITGKELTDDMTDDKAVSVLTSFFTNMGDNLKRFVRTLNSDFEKQKAMVTERIDLTLSKVIEETISSIDLGSLQNTVSEILSKK
mgnify:FL=1